MIWLLGGYMWLFVHRPFEVWPSLGDLQIERGYMLAMILAWLIYPGKTFRLNRLHLAIALFTVVLGAAWMISPYANQLGCTEVVENYAKVTVFYILVVTTVRDEKGLRLLMLLFLAAVSLYMMHSVLEFLRGRYIWRMGIRRMVGVDSTFGDPNAFSSTLLYTVPLLVPFWLERPRRIPVTVLVGYLTVVTGCILLTGSRAAFVGLTLVGFILLLGAVRRKVQAVVLCGLAAGLAFAVLSAALPDELQNRYLTIVDSSAGPRNAQESAEGRIHGILLGLKLWRQSPVLGHGPGSFALINEKRLQAHNLYGQTLSEMGTLGGLALTVLVVCFLMNSREAQRLALADPYRARARNFAYQVSRAVRLNVVMLLLMGCAGHNLYRYNWQWLAAFSAVALACLRARAADPLPDALSPEPGSWGLARPGLAGQG
jgi:O-antigen ligase